MRLPASLALFLCLLAAASAFAQIDPSADHLPGTEPLVMEEPLDVVMVRGINYFAEREIADSPNRRVNEWNQPVKDLGQEIEAKRQRLAAMLGITDFAPGERSQLLCEHGTRWQDLRRSQPDPDESQVVVLHVRWGVTDGITAEGLLLHPSGTPRGYAVAIPDAAWTPEMFCGLEEGLVAEEQLPRRLVQHGLAVLVPMLISRQETFSGHPDIRFTNMPHREFIYRMGFEMGRHIVGYEVLKVLSAVDVLRQMADDDDDRPSTGLVRSSDSVKVCGVGEGGILALMSAAVSEEIGAVLVCGSFQEREQVWQQPIYRNVWRQLKEFGDAELAGLTRAIFIEACRVPEVDGPPNAGRDRSNVAAPGQIRTADLSSVRREFERLHNLTMEEQMSDSATEKVPLTAHLNAKLYESTGGNGPAGSSSAFMEFLKAFNSDGVRGTGEGALPQPSTKVNPVFRQQRQVRELVDYTQKLLHRSDKARDKVWASVDRSSVDKCVASLEAYRDMVYDQMIGRLPEPAIPLNPRMRKVIDEETHVGYEVVLDCYAAGDTERPIPDGADVNIPDTGSVDRIGWAVGKDWGVIAGGILLLPKDLKAGERRPVVVCQHGLEGVPMDTIVTDPNSKGFGPYKGFSTALVKRGFIVYVPQNPYRGHDAFRVIQRKSNPMGRSLFSYIIPQHARTLEWLASLPYVDSDRMAFYGLSYGGKTAVRVPPMLPPGDGKPGYCLSICSADFNEWVRKNASSEDRYSYVYTGEYEIFEWNMGHVANYAELSYLMTPRPFMVERGHDDGVAPDEWVAWEYAKVKRHYDRLGLGDRTELEVFNGPHTINGVGTYAFLHKHLNWPERGGGGEK